MPTVTKPKPITAHDLLSSLPPGVHFGLLEQGPTKDQILTHVGLLLAQERAGSAADSAETDKYVQAIRGQQLDTVKMRLEFSKLADLHAFHEQHSPHSGRAVDDCQHELANAEEALRQAREKFEQSEAAFKAAKRIDEEVQRAAIAIQTRCLVQGTALAEYLARK